MTTTPTIKHYYVTCSSMIFPLCEYLSTVLVCLITKNIRKLYGVDEKVDGKVPDEIKGKEWFVLIRALCIGKR